jgi:hypothetical protein
MRKGNVKPKTGVSQTSRPRSVKPNKQAVSTVSEVDGIDDKYTMDDLDLQEDIQHGVAHPVSAMAELEERVNDLDNAWESESLLGDMLEEISDENITNGKLFQSSLLSPSPSRSSNPDMIVLSNLHNPPSRAVPWLNQSSPLS